MTREICILTGSRAEYGLLRPLIRAIQKTPELELQLAVTGMHLSPQHGMTVCEIEEESIKISCRVNMDLGSDSPEAIGKATGEGVSRFSAVFKEMRPDLLVVLGDRFEILSGVIAALFHRIPVAHIHGGEISEGSWDENIRHAVTKMSHLHFVAAEPYQARVIQMGEAPERVFHVGGLGVDAMNQVELLGRKRLEKELGVTFGKRNLLVSYHPPTLADRGTEETCAPLFEVLANRDDTHVIMTKPNADTGSHRIAQKMEEFAERHKRRAWVFTSLGELKYWSVLKQVDGIIGNSSSGLTEAPSLGIGTINIGSRQSGRLKAQSVIDCSMNESAISESINRLHESDFQSLVQEKNNPYGELGAARKIVQVLTDADLDRLIPKRFFDQECFGEYQ